MVRRNRLGSIWLAGFLLVAGLGISATHLEAQAVGVRVTVTDVRPELLEADLDFTAYTRYSYSTPMARPGSESLNRQGLDRGIFPIPGGVLGIPFLGLPAIDYGDGSTIPYTTLALVSPGGGPGGSNVYRSLASFTHTYPGFGAYTVRSALPCFFCFRGTYSIFPSSSPASPTFVSTYDYIPSTIIGNLAATYRYTYTGSYSDSYSYRYAYTAYLAVTNTARVALAQVPGVPSASVWGLMLLGLTLAGSGLFVLRRL